MLIFFIRWNPYFRVLYSFALRLHVKAELSNQVRRVRMLTWIKNTCTRKCIAETEFLPFPLPSFSHLGSCEHNLIFEKAIAFLQHRASHRDSSYLCVHEISMEKSQEKVHFLSCLEYMSPMKPVIKGIWLGDSFTSALETWPTVSLLQTSFLCWMLLFYLCSASLPLCQPQNLAIRSQVTSHSHTNVQ